MVVFDATMLMLMLRPNSGQPLDSTGQPITQVQERIAHPVPPQNPQIELPLETPAQEEPTDAAILDAEGEVELEGDTDDNEAEADPDPPAG